MTRCARRGCGRRRPRLLVVYAHWGVFLDQEWYCSTSCVAATVRERFRHLPPVEPAWMRRSRPVRLGRLLSEQIGLPHDALSSALARQQQERIPLGQTLQQLGLANTDDVLRALATQSGVRYVKSIDPRRVESRPGGLSRDTVRTLGIVPVSADPVRNELLVACKAPIPGFAVRALARLSNWAVEPLLVSDQALPPLIEAYATGPGCASHVGGFVCDATSGPMAIARWARSRRAARLLYERCDPYVWARLESGGATADVIINLL